MQWRSLPFYLDVALDHLEQGSAPCPRKVTRRRHGKDRCLFFDNLGSGRVPLLVVWTAAGGYYLNPTHAGPYSTILSIVVNIHTGNLRDAQQSHRLVWKCAETEPRLPPPQEAQSADNRAAGQKGRMAYLNRGVIPTRCPNPNIGPTPCEPCAASAGRLCPFSQALHDSDPLVCAVP